MERRTKRFFIAPVTVYPCLIISDCIIHIISFHFIIGYYRDSVDRNKSANKVRLSTEKWESINNENEVDGRGDIKVGRNRTRESIKRWEEKTFNQPNLPFQHPRPAAQTKPIKPRQSQQSYSERWDPLWGDRPLNDSKPRPVSWDMRLFNEDREDNYRSFIEPRERKVSHVSKKSTEDLKRIFHIKNGRFTSVIMYNDVL